MSKLSLICIMLLSACHPQVDSNNFDVNICKKYQTDLFKKYKSFRFNNIIQNPLDFVLLYSSLCSFAKLEKGKDYEIVQVYDVVDDNSKNEKSFTYELLHFKEAVKLDSTIKHIKEKNCIDAFNIKIHRIYRVGPNTIICVNYVNFDPVNYESFLKNEFKNVNIEIINKY